MYDWVWTLKMGIFEMFLSTSDVQTSASLFLSMASHDKVYIETLASQEDMYSMSPMDSQSQPQHHHKSLSLSSHEIAKPVSNSRSHPCRSSRDKTPQETRFLRFIRKHDLQPNPYRLKQLKLERYSWLVSPPAALSFVLKSIGRCAVVNIPCGWDNDHMSALERRAIEG